MVRNSLKKSAIAIIICSMPALYSCALKQNSASSTRKETVCCNNCNARNKSVEMSCKLTTPELRERKETVIESLKQKIVGKKELKDGFAFKFQGTDDVLDELIEFIKTERECCDFFTFAISVSGDKSEAWLELTGADGAKDFITAELGL